MSAPGWWRVESSILDQLEPILDKSLTRKPPSVWDIMAILPAAVIQHEFNAHLIGFEWFQSQGDMQDES